MFECPDCPQKRPLYFFTGEGLYQHRVEDHGLLDFEHDAEPEPVVEAVLRINLNPPCPKCLGPSNRVGVLVRRKLGRRQRYKCKNCAHVFEGCFEGNKFEGVVTTGEKKYGRKIKEKNRSVKRAAGKKCPNEACGK